MTEVQRACPKVRSARTASGHSSRQGAARGRGNPRLAQLLTALCLLTKPAGAAELPTPRTSSTTDHRELCAPASAVDLRPTLEKWGLNARVQGERPTCSVFTLTGAMEFALARQQQRGERLSVEFLNWAANQVRGGQHDGGFFSDLWNGFAAHGICPEEQMPYQPEFVPAASPSAEAVAKAKAVRALRLKLHWIKKWNVRTGLTEDQFLAIKRTLNQGWPVCAGCRWPKQEEWQRDVLQLCPPKAVRDGHSVLLVGYRDDAEQPGGGVLIFRNSSRRGRDGYMPYAYGRRYVNDAVWIGSGVREEQKEPPQDNSRL